MNKTVVAAIVVAVLVLGGGAFWWMNRDTQLTYTVNNETTTQTGNTVSTEDENVAGSTQLAAFTKENVAEHATKDDCWTIISDKVYDITSYLARHPGGNAITAACGTDGTMLFTQRKTADGEKVGSGTPHSSRANEDLSQFLKGDLVNEAAVVPTGEDAATQ